LDAFKEAFNAIDKSGSGKIDRKELEIVLEKLGPSSSVLCSPLTGQKPKEEELRIMLEIDPSHDGQLTFSTVCQIM
jgi:Ca2+-binding EF-hand superfamily protein